MKKYPDTDFDLKTVKNGDFEIIELKEGWLNNRNVLKIPHRHVFHEIVWITQGADFHMVDFDDYNLCENEILCIPKNSIHDFKPDEKTHGWKLIFEDNFFTSTQLHILKEFQMLIPCLGNKALQLDKIDADIINSIIKLLNNVSGIRQKQTLVLNLLIFMEDCYLSKVSNRDSKFVDFLKLLNKNIYKHKQIYYYTNKLGITDKALNQTIKDATGKTSQNYIHTRLLNEAKSKLCYSNHSIKEIAYSLGFEDALYFSRFFKKKTENSPEEFRKQFS